MNTKAKFYELIAALFQMSKEREDAESWALALKLGEELGEFQEAVLKEYGYLQHKEVKEDPFHEAADIINVLIGFFAVHYPGLSAEQLTEKLYEAIASKGDKYAKVVLGLDDARDVRS